MNEETGNLTFFSEDRFDPCKVCGEPSSGWHCGAVTCEACKKFFLRSINGEDAKYKCLRNQDCVIVRATRTQCQYCRFKKCLEVGMTTNDNSANPTVAELFKRFPCCVCTAPSSGIHFGAITCEGCKGFFRRSIKERAPEKYRCMDSGNCNVILNSRNMCRHCRFQRCIQNGMSASNSRIGRQSNLFKHQIIEWQNKGIKAFTGCLVSRKPKRVKLEPGLVGNDSTTSTPLSNVNTDNSNSSLSMNMTPLPTLVNNTSNYDPISFNQIQPIQNLNCINNMTNLNTPNMNVNVIAQQQIIQNHHYDSSNTAEYAPVNNDIYTPSFNDPTQMSQTYMMNSNYTTQHMGPIAQTNSVYYTWSSNQMPNQMGTSTMNDQMPLVSQAKQSHQQQMSTVCIEDSLEEPLKVIIKVIYQSYTEYISNLADSVNNELMKMNMFNNNMNYQTYQSAHLGSVVEILRYLNFYAKKVLSFSQNIPGLSSLSSEDKEELVKSSIHSVILLSIQRKCTHLNYFNCDSAKFERYLRKLPQFNRTSYFIKTVREKFEKYKLDDKEYALYSALIVTSTACQHLTNYDQINEVRENIGNALRKYMITRRNEDISCDDIVMMLSHFKKVNTVLQADLIEFYNKVISTHSDAFKDNQLFYKVYLPTNSNVI